LKKWGLLLSSIPLLIATSRQYDIVLVSGFRVIGITSLVVGRILKKKCIFKADNNGEMSGEFFYAGLKKVGWRPGSPVFKFLIELRNRLFRRADAFVAISSQIAEEYLNSAIEAEKIHRIPNCTDTKLFHPVPKNEKPVLRKRLQLAENATIVAFVGRLVSYKGLPGLLRTWKSLSEAHRNAVLLLIGGGSLDIHNCESELREYVRSHDLLGSVHFCGEVSNVHEYLQASDIFVFPTEREGFGIALVEAMACGLPVVATPIGGSRDFLTHGQNGVLVKPGDEEELRVALDGLISERAYAQTLGQCAVRTVRTSFDVDVVVRSYLGVLNKALRK
jgi:glycosyltransferase involved in cell wall biosynthesis